MEKNDIWSLFKEFDRKYFGNTLNKVKLSWSPRMTLCAGKTAFKVWKRGGTSCNIRLSQPLLSQRPHYDTVNTLLHEMIHAYLHVTQGLNYRDSHGPEFRSHMNRINIQEGSKITIYHNFRKEVDKYRVNVYRCDGPCVKKRPFFGILRRAIERPPGPTDGWWAKHQSECGGTFHKIGGPDVSSKDQSVERKNLRMGDSKTSSKFLNSKLDCGNPSVPIANNRTESFSRKSTDSKKNIFNKSYESQKGNFNEEIVLKRIRDKYANIKQTIMLSKEAVDQLSNQAAVSEVVNHVSGSYPSNSSYRYPAPFGNYKDGNMNYSYQSHSPKQIKIQKYLKKYREARKPLEYISREYIKVSQPIAGNNKSVSHDKVSELQNNIGTMENRSLFDYAYKSKTPDKIRLEKYIYRYNLAVNSTANSIVSSYASHEGTSKPASVSLQLENCFVKDISSLPSTSKTTLCPICSVQLPLEEYDQHLGKCFGDDTDFFDDYSPNEKYTIKVSAPKPTLQSRKEKTSSNDWGNDFEATSCKNCGSKVFLEEMPVHLQYCTDSDNELDVEDSHGRLTYQSPKDKNKLAVEESLNKEFVSCPSCMEKVKEENIHDHLDECLKFVCEEF